MQGIYYITPHEILKGREIEYPLSDELKKNLDLLLTALNRLRVFYGKPMIITSGYRPGRYNKAAGGAVNSAHLTCEAADISDPQGELAKFLIEKAEILMDCGLYMEDPRFTRGWVHVSIRKPPSGKLVFIPGGKSLDS